MPAHNREFPDVDWFECRIPGISTALRNIDEKTVKAANGKDGSTHEPTNPLVIGGAGMVCAGLWEIQGPVTTSPGAHIKLGAGHASDYLRLMSGHPGVSRSMTSVALPAIPETYLYSYATAQNNGAQVARFPSTRHLLALRPHDRSTLTGVRLRFKVTYSHASLPVLPKFRVIRVSKRGVVQALHTARSGSYKDDAFLDMPTSAANVAAYQAGGAYQWSNLYEPNQFNVIDRSQYAYFVDFVEESGASAFVPNVDLGAGAGTNILRGEMTCASISLLAPQ